MTTFRTTIRIDHIELDPRVLHLISLVKQHHLTTSHVKGVVVTRPLDGGKKDDAE